MLTRAPGPEIAEPNATPRGRWDKLCHARPSGLSSDVFRLLPFHGMRHEVRLQRYLVGGHALDPQRVEQVLGD